MASALAVLGEAFGAEAVSFVPAADAEALPAAVAEGVSWVQTSSEGDTREVGPAEVPVVGGDSTVMGVLRIQGDNLDGDSQALRVVGVVLGAHIDRLVAEATRKQSEDRWRWLVDRHPDPTFVVAGDHILYANRAAAVLLAAPGPDALHARPFEDFLLPDEMEKTNRCQRAQLLTDRPAPFEHTVVRLDGDERLVECVSVPFPGVEGGVQTVLRDVTQRRTSEERYRTFVETISEGVWRIELDRPVSRHASPRVQTDHVLSSGRLAELNPVMSRMFGGVDLPPPWSTTRQPS